MIAPATTLRERYDAILLDLDGTLLDGSSKLTPRTCRAVRSLVESGFEVLICTGRSDVGTLGVYEELGLDGALVAYNGAWIGRPGGAIWRKATIPDGLVPAVARGESLAAFSFRHHGDHKYAVRRAHPLFDDVAAWYQAAVVLDAPAPLPSTDLMRVSLFFDGPEHLDRAWQTIIEDGGIENGGIDDDGLRLYRETFPMSIFPEFRTDRLHLCEIQRQSRGKAEVFTYLETERGIPASRVVAVGDHRNDISMLRAAGLPIAIGNAVPAVLDVARLVIGRHDEDGVAAWVEAGCPLPPADDAPADVPADAPGDAPGAAS